MIHELKLIQIHKKNLEILNQQKARLGEYLPVYLQNQIEGELQQITELEITLKRRLQQLLEKAALKGINAEPETSIEIEDIQEYFSKNNLIPMLHSRNRKKDELEKILSQMTPEQLRAFFDKFVKSIDSEQVAEQFANIAQKVVDSTTQESN